ENQLNRYGQPKIAVPPKKSGHIQMTLFHWQENEVLERIKQLDLQSMTPIQALQMLETLQNQAKSLE
ncbi:MAG: hypothetical protein ACK5OB_09300, partial [Pirellula sp.]